MNSRESEQASILATYIDDLLADRPPKLSSEDESAFTPEELAEALGTLRLLKGLVRPSLVGADFRANLRSAIVSRVSAERILQQSLRSTSPAVILSQKRVISGVSVARSSEESGLNPGEIEALERGILSPFDVDPVRLLALARSVALAGQELLAAMRSSASHWVEKAIRQRSYDSALGLAGIDLENSSQVDDPRVRREEAARIAVRAATLARLLRNEGQPSV